MATAEAETSAYEEKLRNAKREIFEMREQRRKQWNEERDAALAAVRTQAQQRIQTARQEIERSTAEARTRIESATAELSTLVLNAVLPTEPVATEVAQ